MDLTTLKFLILVALAVLGYYLVPKRMQWIWLLGAGYVYYAMCDTAFVKYMVFTTLTTYAAGLLLGRVRSKGSRKAVMILCLLLNFGMLGFLKYSNFIIEIFNGLAHRNISLLVLVAPLGISFYTFQSMGYVLDVYWKRIEPDKNPFRLALFVSFFPQIMQGPIGRYSRLANQLYESHRFDIVRTEQAMFRILWGFFKKLVIADTAAVFVAPLFDDFQTYSGCAILAVLFYAIQLYADFSGGIDVVIGIGMLFGIEMDENFRQPYFSISIGDFWHRWHITLGAWMKDYLFYPVTLSGWMKKIGKGAKKVFGKKIGRALPICLANIIVFFVVGIWHGPEWKYIIYGLYNGLIIGISGMLTDNFRSWKKKLGINDKGKPWHLFMILRTFILVLISFYFDRAANVSDAFAMMKNSVTQFDPGQLLTITSESGQTALQMILIILAGLVPLLIHSIQKERGVDTLSAISARPAPVRILLFLALFFVLGLIGEMPSLTGGFIYAQF